MNFEEYHRTREENFACFSGKTMLVRDEDRVGASSGCRNLMASAFFIDTPTSYRLFVDSREQIMTSIAQCFAPLSESKYVAVQFGSSWLGHIVSRLFILYQTKPPGNYVTSQFKHTAMHSIANGKDDEVFQNIEGSIVSHLVLCR